MALYKHILVGLDLSEESKQVLDKAELLAETHQANISLIHVIEPLTFAYAGDLPIDLSDTQQILQDRAQKSLSELASKMRSKAVSAEIQIGQTALELHQKAEEIGADLIVVGSHGRHGIALLLGSTASGVIHGATCDVLAIRI